MVQQIQDQINPRRLETKEDLVCFICSRRK
jgi:hypothetical protein